jgi:hypothetical protein
MKKIFSVLMALTIFTSLFATRVSAAPTAMLTPTPTSGSPVELGQLKVCKAAGAGVTVGKLFTINVNNITYSVPAGPGDGGYCVLAGQFPVNTQVTVQESIPAGYYVSHIEVKPDRSISRDLTLGKAVVEIGSGVTEVILTNRAIGAPTPVITFNAQTLEYAHGHAPLCAKLHAYAHINSEGPAANLQGSRWRGSQWLF